MTRLKLLLLLVASCSVMFIGLVLLGSYYWVQHARFIALPCFLVAFICALGQIGALAVFLRERALQQWQRSQTAASPSTSTQTSNHE